MSDGRESVWVSFNDNWRHTLDQKSTQNRKPQLPISKNMFLQFKEIFLFSGGEKQISFHHFSSLVMEAKQIIYSY